MNLISLIPLVIRHQRKLFSLIKSHNPQLQKQISNNATALGGNMSKHRKTVSLHVVCDCSKPASGRLVSSALVYRE